jgi:acetyl-CoA carboxylase beta subunit
VDRIVPRAELRSTLAKLLRMLRDPASGADALLKAT